MQKEYGTLTEDQFRRLVRKLPEFRREAKEFHDTLRSASPEKLREVLVLMLGSGWTRTNDRGIMSWGKQLF